MPSTKFSFLVLKAVIKKYEHFTNKNQAKEYCTITYTTVQLQCYILSHNNKNCAIDILHDVGSCNNKTKIKQKY